MRGSKDKIIDITWVFTYCIFAHIKKFVSKIVINSKRMPDECLKLFSTVF